MPASLAGWLQETGRTARHPLFRAYAALSTCTCTYTGHYLFLAGSAFLLIEREGLGAWAYAMVLSVGSLVHLAGTVACRRSLLRSTVAHAAWLTADSGPALIALALAGVQSAWAVIVPHWCDVFAHAIHQSCGQAAVMTPFPRSAGTAAALSGTSMPLVATAVAAALAVPLGPSAMALPLGLCVCALLTSTVAWTWAQWHGTLPPTHAARVRSASARARCRSFAAAARPARCRRSASARCCCWPASLSG